MSYLSRFPVLSLCLCGKLPLHFRRFLPSHPLQRHATDDAVDIREPIATLSGISRVSRLPFVSIQRLAPPPLPFRRMLCKFAVCESKTSPFRTTFSPNALY